MNGGAKGSAPSCALSPDASAAQGGTAEVLTAAEVAAWLRLNPATVYRLAQSGAIPAVKVGRVWRFSRRLLDEWLDGRMWANLAEGGEG
jgi:excisionase family DNA binding protein